MEVPRGWPAPLAHRNPEPEWLVRIAAKWEIFIDRRVTLRVAFSTIACGSFRLNVSFRRLGPGLSLYIVGLARQGKIESDRIVVII